MIIFADSSADKLIKTNKDKQVEDSVSPKLKTIRWHNCEHAEVLFVQINEKYAAQQTVQSSGQSME